MSFILSTKTQYKIAKASLVINDFMTQELDINMKVYQYTSLSSVSNYIASSARDYLGQIVVEDEPIELLCLICMSYAANTLTTEKTDVQKLVAYSIGQAIQNREGVEGLKVLLQRFPHKAHQSLLLP